MKVKVTLEDTFSFAKNEKVVDVDQSMLDKMHSAMQRNAVVWREFSDAINWAWRINKIELI